MKEAFPKRILVTGGAGFVGSNLAIWLRRNHPASEVVAADSLRRRGSELNLARLRRHGVRFVHCDVRNTGDLRLEGPPFGLVLDCAADPSVTAARRGSGRFVVDTNLLGTINVLDLAREHGGIFPLDQPRLPHRGPQQPLQTGDGEPV